MSLTIYKISSYLTRRGSGTFFGGGGSTNADFSLLLSNYYTKTELQTAGSSTVDWNNIINEPNGMWTITEDSGLGNILEPIDISVGIDQISLPFLPVADSSLMNIVYYDPITGFLSYGVESGGDTLWMDDSNDYLVPLEGDSKTVAFAGLVFSQVTSVQTALTRSHDPSDPIITFTSPNAGFDASIAIQAWNQFWVNSNTIGLNGVVYIAGTTMADISSWPNSPATHLRIQAGYDAGGGNGGNLYLAGGFPSGSGADYGDIYFSDSGVGVLPLAESDDTGIVMYNPTTGKLSYSIA